MPNEIHNPRRILAVALAGSQDHLAKVVGDLTGTYPSGALAGTTQELDIATPYYRAQVPLWLDLVGVPAPESGENEASGANGGSDRAAEAERSGERQGDDDLAETSTPAQWADAFLGDEAREVRDALGGVVAVVDVGSTGGGADAAPKQRELIEHVGRLVRGLGRMDEGEDGGGNNADDDAGVYREPWDGVALVVGISQAQVDEDAQLSWDDYCIEAGLEFVLVAPGQSDKNAWGEKTGTARVLEALQANDWASVTADHDPFGAFQGAAEDGSDVDDPESLDFGFDRADFEGLRQAIWQQKTKATGGNDAADEDDEDADDNDHAEAMQRLIGKLQAARMQAEVLPPAQRRAMAARVVGEVMDEI